MENVEFFNVVRHEAQSNTVFVVQLVLMAIFGVIAAYLSWTSNTVVGYSVPLKILFAVGAFLLGPTYIIYYLFMKYDLLSKIKKMDKAKQ